MLRLRVSRWNLLKTNTAKVAGTTLLVGKGPPELESIAQQVNDKLKGSLPRLKERILEGVVAREETKMKLNVKAFALVCGLLWAFGVLCITWWIIAFDGVTMEPTLIGRLYRGYNISPVGSIVGLVWGFFDGLIGGAIFAWLYNLIASRTSAPPAT